MLAEFMADACPLSCRISRRDATRWFGLCSCFSLAWSDYQQRSSDYTSNDYIPVIPVNTTLPQSGQPSRKREKGSTTPRTRLGSDALMVFSGLVAKTIRARQKSSETWARTRCHSSVLTTLHARDRYPRDKRARQRPVLQVP